MGGASVTATALQDDGEIRALLCRERYARDTCQWQKLRDSYHPDASRTLVDITWYDQFPD